ncbi:MAG: RagB/SusD family nutrient uptake outer membrane protein [Cytophagales bacterium]|nr:RagB/SusD family nutrient uptake outer membrane protein [Cytophagales bacterium]
MQAYNPSDIWNDYTQAEAYVNDLYNNLMPNSSFYSGRESDEAPDFTGTVYNDFLKGTATIESYNYWPYAIIRKINFLLERVDSGTLTDDKIALLEGQALFWRAFAYFGMVKAYGGVPLVLSTQSSEEGDDLFVPRNKTSECIAQIVKDLDDAISKLPDSWTEKDYGRVNKGIAMAFKGRVLLFYASPQFNPNNDADRWIDAYNANKSALQFLSSQGKELYPDYDNIWYDEGNSECIMVHQYYYPDHVHNENFVRPIWATANAVGGDRPTLELVNAFPMRDGSEYDPETMGYDTLWKNRDDRFYATIAYNGSNYGISDLEGDYLWSYVWQDGESVQSAEQYYGSGTGSVSYNFTGFYRKKAIDKDVNSQTIALCDVDWIEIRFTEVLMNFGEAANEIGKPEEALQVLYDVRKRAGIESGDGRFGLKANTKDEIRAVYVRERQVEFAFEGKRWDDIRRWRRFDILNNHYRRHGLLFWLNPGEQGPSGTDNIDEIWNKFTPQAFEVEKSSGEFFNLNDNYYFYGIPKVHLDQNPNLEQTQGWDGGTFDPLK